MKDTINRPLTNGNDCQPKKVLNRFLGASDCCIKRIRPYLPNLSEMAKGFISQPLRLADVQLLNISDQTCTIKSSVYLPNDLNRSPREISPSSLLSSNRAHNSPFIPATFTSNRRATARCLECNLS